MRPTPCCLEVSPTACEPAEEKIHRDCKFSSAEKHLFPFAIPLSSHRHRAVVNAPPLPPDCPNLLPKIQIFPLGYHMSYQTYRVCDPNARQIIELQSHIVASFCSPQHFALDESPVLSRSITNLINRWLVLPGAGAIWTFAVLDFNKSQATPQL